MNTRPKPISVLISMCALANLAAHADIPSPPENLRAAHLYPDEALLTWNEATGAAGYNVYRFDDGAGAWSTVAQGISVTHFRDTGVTNASTSYAVSASNAEGDSAAAQGTAVADPNAWMTFNLMQEYWSIYDTVATVGWSASLAVGADGILELGLSPGDLPFFAWDTNFTSSHWFTVTNLLPGTTYYMRITGVGPNGAGSSGMTYFTTLPTNHPPVPNGQLFYATEDGGPIFIWFDAWDPDGHQVTVQPVGQPLNGQLIAGDWGALYYVPNPDFWGTDYVVFEASDGRATALGTNTIGVAPSNDPPTANDLVVTQPEDNPIVSEIALPASDPDGDYLQVIFTSMPVHGFVSSFGLLCYYTSDPNYNGADSFTYKVSDGVAESAEATVTITVTPVNDAPSGSPQAIDTDEDTAVFFTPNAVDIDGDPMTYLIEPPPAFGIVTNSGSQLVYVPNANFNGWDAFGYRASDGSELSASISVIVEVRPVNDAPVTDAVSLASPEDTEVSIALPATDPEMDGILFSIVTGPSHGTVLLDGTMAYYTPNVNFNGVDSFSFTGQDGSLTGNTSTVTVTVTPVNDPPSANDLSVTTAEDTALSIPIPGSDLDGDALSVTIVTPPNHGSLVGNFGMSRIYRPTADYFGPDSFRYRVTDTSGLSAEGTISITVTPVNDAPVTIGQSVMIEEDTAATVQLMASDYDQDPLTYIIVSGPAHGTLTGTGPTFVYTPNPNYFGFDEFVYKVSDGILESPPTTVDFGILAVADAPVAASSSWTTSYNTPVSLVLTGTDADGDSITYSLVTVPAHGTLSGTAPNLTFTPVIGWSGATSFDFRVSDGTLNSSAASVTITVQPPVSVPAAPTALTATTISSSEINLSWTDNSGNNEDGFAIERAGNGNSWLQIGTVGPNVSVFTAAGLSSNKTYTFRVRAYNALGNSAYSNAASARTSR